LRAEAERGNAHRDAVCGRRIVDQANAPAYAE
jgi:hypothetical protein